MVIPTKIPEDGATGTATTPASFSGPLCERFPRLTKLPSAALDRIVRQGKHMVLPDGVPVFDEHGPCGAFPLLLAGAVRVFKQAASGRQLLLYRVEPGELCVLTTSCLLGQGVYAASGVTEGDTEMVVIGAALFNELLASCEEFRALVFSILSERIADLMQRVEEVAFQRLDRRLASLLVARAPELRATHQELADELGSVREMVTRLLRGFEKHGWVRLGRERVSVTDLNSLRRLAEDEA